MSNFFVLSIALIVILGGALSHASGDLTLIASRGADGEFLKQSKRNLNRIRAEAKIHGEVKVWITFDLPLARTRVQLFDTQRRDSYVSQFITPLVDSGDIQILDIPNGPDQAPGCLLSASETALDELAMRSEIRHIIYSSESHDEH